MRRFELLIPKSEKTPFALTVRVSAETWLDALSTGVNKLELGSVQNLLVDIHDDNTIHVTDPESGRVFRIRELDDPAPEMKTLETKAPEAKAPSPVAAPMPPVAKAKIQPVSAPRPVAAVGLVKKIAPAPAPPPAPAENIEVERTEAAMPPIGRPKAPASEKQKQDALLERLFEQTQHVWSEPRTLRQAAEFFMDLTMTAIPAESGAVFISELGRSDLYFAAACGPKAQEAMKFTVPRGQGLVGYSVEHNCALAVSNADKDPRFYAAISAKLGYPTKSLAVAPSQKDGRAYGAIEVMNKRDSRFSENELMVLDYLGQRLADFLEQHFASA